VKVYRVLLDRDSETTKEPGIAITKTQREDIFYAADTMEEVWDEIEWLRDDPNCNVVAIFEEYPSIHLLRKMQMMMFGPVTEEL
jgi:hypothetical protein